MQDNRLPVFDHRLEVFQQVISVPFLYFVSTLKTWIDTLCNATYNNTDFRVHEVVCTAFLQKVDALSLTCPHWLTCIARIFKGTFVKPSVYTMIAVVLVWTIAFFFANLFQCWPLWINWFEFGATFENCINTNVMYLAQAWSDVLTDCKKCLVSKFQLSNHRTVIILTLPLPCVGNHSLITQVFANLNPDLGDAVACKAQGGCKRNVPSRRLVSCGTTSQYVAMLIKPQNSGSWDRKTRCFQRYCSRYVSGFVPQTWQILIHNMQKRMWDSWTSAVWKFKSISPSLI